MEWLARAGQGCRCFLPGVRFARLWQHEDGALSRCSTTPGPWFCGSSGSSLISSRCRKPVTSTGTSCNVDYSNHRVHIADCTRIFVKQSSSRNGRASPGGVTAEAPYDIRFRTPSIAYLSGMEFDPIHEAQMSSRDRHASTERGHFENDDPPP